MKAKAKFEAMSFLFGDVMIMLPMIVYHPKNTGNFVGNSGNGKYKKC